jgi:pSer/pThr/pTyr-binding forkhead associated (FHA) protein
VHAPVQSLSRVHVVLLDVQGELFLFDSGSTNGTWAEGEQLSALALESGGSLKLGEEVTLKWACAH